MEWAEVVFVWNRAVVIVKILGGQSVERIFLRNFVGGRWRGSAWIMI